MQSLVSYGWKIDSGKDQSCCGKVHFCYQTSLMSYTGQKRTRTLCEKERSHCTSEWDRLSSPSSRETSEWSHAILSKYRPTISSMWWIEDYTYSFMWSCFHYLFHQAICIWGSNSASCFHPTLSLRGSIRVHKTSPRQYQQAHFYVINPCVLGFLCKWVSSINRIVMCCDKATLLPWKAASLLLNEISI